MRILPMLLLAACATSGKIDLTREIDGAWVHTFPDATTEQAYHASMAALVGKGWTVARADPIGRSFTAKSPVEKGVTDIWYRLAHMVVEPGLSGGARVRLGLVSTHEYSRGGREPNNDHAISDRGDYEEIFLAVQSQLAE